METSSGAEAEKSQRALAFGCTCSTLTSWSCFAAVTGSSASKPIRGLNLWSHKYACETSASGASRCAVCERWNNINACSATEIMQQEFYRPESVLYVFIHVSKPDSTWASLRCSEKAQFATSTRRSHHHHHNNNYTNFLSLSKGPRNIKAHLFSWRGRWRVYLYSLMIWSSGPVWLLLGGWNAAILTECKILMNYQWYHLTDWGTAAGSLRL